MEELFMRWKLTTLIENHVDKEERYMCEHGLAILIESENQEEQVCLLMRKSVSTAFSLMINFACSDK